MADLGFTGWRIGSLKCKISRRLFGPKADRLTPEQEEQLKQLNQDLQDEAQRPTPVSDQILEDEDRASRRRRQRQQRKRRPLPEHLETETVTIEPEVTLCPCCGKPLQKIGEEVSEQIDLIPAKLIRRRTVRPKYACPYNDSTMLWHKLRRCKIF
jgi:Ser-tRNA(Ala) deacylase AlaX